MAQDKLCAICHQSYLGEHLSTFCCDGVYAHNRCLEQYWGHSGFRCLVCRTEYGDFKPRVYFAGKVTFKSPYDRISISPEEFPSSDEDEVFKERLTYVITGPIVISDDHGCCHGSTSHGCGEDCCENNTATRKDIMLRCMKQIDLAEVFVLYADNELSCYGSLVEAGYAYAKGKLIFVRLGDVENEKDKKELWFVIQQSMISIENNKDMAKRVYPLLFKGKLETYIEQMQVYLKRHRVYDDEPSLYDSLTQTGGN